MLAILKIETRRFSKGTFPYSPATRTLKIDSIVQAVLQEIDGNQFQDGGRGGHIENRNTPISLLTPTTHTKATETDYWMDGRDDNALAHLG
jgi:hypothetical protein